MSVLKEMKHELVSKNHEVVDSDLFLTPAILK